MSGFFAATIFVIPAYGRDYSSEADCLADWQAGKDFRATGVHSGYCSIRDTDYMRGREIDAVDFRYDKGSRQTLISL
ncbi:MAG: hypothetical protein EHM32_02570 [Spirochaetales bacterium]|nr:MAG: hypothetical protein EHM32_02570 [Spirochaetales bacterium]